MAIQLPGLKSLQEKTAPNVVSKTENNFFLFRQKKVQQQVESHQSVDKFFSLICTGLPWSTSEQSIRLSDLIDMCPE